MWIVYLAAVLFIVWVLMNFKTSRPDGTLIKTHPYRRMMFFLFPVRDSPSFFLLSVSFLCVEQLASFYAVLPGKSSFVLY